MALKPDVLSTMLLQISNANREVNLITSIFDVHLKCFGTKAKMILDFDYDLPEDYYTVIVAASNDPDFNKASSSGSLGYWFVRIAFKNARLIDCRPLAFIGETSNIKKDWYSIL